MKLNKKFIALILVLCMGLSACGIVETINNEITSTYKINDDLVVYEDYESYAMSFMTKCEKEAAIAAESAETASAAAAKDAAKAADAAAKAGTPAEGETSPIQDGATQAAKGAEEAAAGATTATEGVAMVAEGIAMLATIADGTATLADCIKKAETGANKAAQGAAAAANGALKAAAGAVMAAGGTPEEYEEVEAPSVIDLQAALKNAELALENDYLQLYVGSNCDVILVNKITGQATYSNPAYYELTDKERNSLAADEARDILSQINLEYYNSSLTKSYMSSYPDCISSDRFQAKYSVSEDGKQLTVTYGIGTNYDETGLITVFTEETFLKYSDKLSEKMKAEEITIIDYRDFINSYTKYNYATMSPDDKKLYTEMYPALEEQGVLYIMKTKLTNKMRNKLLQMYSIVGIDASVKEAEDIKLGDYVSGSVPAYFKIPLVYTLSGNDLIAQIDLQSIETVEGFYLSKVEVLKSFGATKAEDDGYMFVPDGSGMIIENGVSTTSMDSIDISFYGQDYSTYYASTQEMSIDNTLPVFGIKKGDNSVFGIVESGTAISGMAAQTVSSYMRYNVIYPYFTYYLIDNFGIEGVSYSYYGNAPQTTFAVRYHFLSGDNADYSGMASYYQDYLIKKGDLKKEKTTEDGIGLDIQLMGAVNKTVNTFGIPYETSYPITTFEQAEEIMKKFSEQGIDRANILYSGIFNGGMEFEAMNKLEVVKKLGGAEGFKQMVGNLSSANVSVYPEADLTRVFEKGNAVMKNEDVSKFISKSTVMMPDWSILINPLRYKAITEEFVTEYEKMGTQKLYLGSVGTYLNGNYSEEEGTTKETVRTLTEEMLKIVDDKGYEILLDCGNDYTLKYADRLTNIATTSSHQRVEGYTIPFVGMVFKGYIPYTCRAINQSSNSEVAVLQAIESGAGLNYLLMYENQLNLEDTYYSDLYSINYNIWFDKIVEKYTEVNDAIGYLANTRIVKHEHLAEDVNCVTYEDGSKIYVNYGKTDYATEDGTVAAMSYLPVK